MSVPFTRKRDLWETREANAKWGVIGDRSSGLIQVFPTKTGAIKYRNRLAKTHGSGFSVVPIPRTNSARKNPTKAQKREKTRKASVERRAAAALRKYLKIKNPAMKTVGAAVQQLKRGVLKITPIKANAGPNSFRKRKKAAYRAEDSIAGPMGYTGRGRLPIRKEKTERKRRRR